MTNYQCTRGCSAQEAGPGPGCSESFQRLLQLLCRSNLSAAVNFNAFAFVSSYYLLGSGLEASCTDGDNLTGPCASWLCGDRCEEDTVSGDLYPPIPGAGPLPFPVREVHLCPLKALVFDAMADPTGSADPFQVLCQGLSRRLQPGPQSCPGCRQTATAAMGPLLVEQAVILGQLGPVLVLANAEKRRFYLLCTEQLDYLG